MDDKWIPVIANGFIVGMMILFFLLYMIIADYDKTESSVKVIEVGERYAFLNWGHQYYIRLLNTYSDQYTPSSESWTTCINPIQYEMFKNLKENKTIVQITVEGYGLSNKFICISGDRVTGIKGS